MYLRFFNLREHPFNLTPDPRFLFLSPQHEEALSNLLYGIQERKGFIEITGEVGTGKTSLCRTLLDRLDDTVSTALIFNSYLNETELLQAIVNDFGLTCREATRQAYLDALNQYLLHEFTAGRNAVVLIDEAQNLEPRVLEQLRMLSNLETERGKLLQVVLVGQPELRDKLSTPQMRQLEQRIAVRFHLGSLSRAETQQYIAHRLTVAGNGNAITFTAAALTSLQRHCAGIPRRINLLCDRILVSAYVRGTQRVTTRLVRQSVHDLGGFWQQTARRSVGVPSVLVGVLLGALATAGLIGGLTRYWTGTAEPVRIQAPVSGRDMRARQSSVPPRPRSARASTTPTVMAPQPAAAQPAPQPTVKRPPPQAAAAQPAPRAAASLSLAAVPPRPLPAAGPARKPELQATPRQQELAHTLWHLKAQSEARLAASPTGARLGWARRLAPAAANMGLAVMPLEAILPQLTRLSRPCFIEVVPDPAAPQTTLWVLVQGFADRVLVYREPDGFGIMHLQELRRVWYGKLYLTLSQELYSAPLLSRGMQGRRVEVLQRALKQLGYLTGDPTGHFDGVTLRAVQGFQRDNLLVVDGYVGRRTLMMLLHFGGQSLEDAT